MKKKKAPRRKPDPLAKFQNNVRAAWRGFVVKAKLFFMLFGIFVAIYFIIGAIQ